jgi:hypothetical protein
MSKPSARTILFAGIAAALLAALPAAAVPAQPAPAAPAAVTAPATPACQLNLASPFAAPPAASAPALPEWLDLDANGGISTAPSHKFSGFCPCGCSTKPDCNTDADCGGGTCSQFISCC